MLLLEHVWCLLFCALFRREHDATDPSLVRISEGPDLLAALWSGVIISTESYGLCTASILKRVRSEDRVFAFQVTRER